MAKEIGQYVLRGVRRGEENAYQEDRYFAKNPHPLNGADAAYLLCSAINEINGETFRESVGSTFTGAIITKDCGVITAHLGDSPAAVFIFDPEAVGDEESIFGSPTHAMRIRHLITPHTPTQGRTEFERFGQSWVEEAGRVNNDLAVNRSLGDADLWAALSKRVDLESYDFSGEIKAGKRVFLLVASDGVGDISTHTETIADLVANGSCFKDIAQKLCKDSSVTGDNVSVLFTEIAEGKSAVLSVFDGHSSHHGKSGTAVSKRARHLFMESVRHFESEKETLSMEQKIQQIIASQYIDYLLPIERLEKKASAPTNIIEAENFFLACMGDYTPLYEPQADLVKTPNYAQDKILFERDKDKNLFAKFYAGDEIKISDCEEALHFRNGNVEAYQFRQGKVDGTLALYRVISLEDAQNASSYFERKVYDTEGALISFSATMQSGNEMAQNISIAQDVSGKYLLKRPFLQLPP